MTSRNSYDGSSLCLCGSDGKGAVLFTGPDGVGDYSVHIEEQRYIGHGTMSPEGTADVQYLCRAAKGTPHPPPKTSRVGEVGWGVPVLSDNSLLKSGNQIMLKEFRQAVEDRHTHLYQNPHYPPSTFNPNKGKICPYTRPDSAAAIELPGVPGSTAAADVGQEDRKSTKTESETSSLF